MTLHIENTLSERLDCFDYVNKCMSGRLFYHNLIQLTPRDVNSSSDTATLSKRSTQWLTLGLSIADCMSNPFPIAVAQLCTLFDEYQAHYLRKGLFKNLSAQPESDSEVSSVTKGIDAITKKRTLEVLKPKHFAIPLSYYDVVSNMFTILSSLYLMFLDNEAKLNEAQFSKIDSSINSFFLSKILNDLTELAKQALSSEIENLELNVTGSSMRPRGKTLGFSGK